MLLVTVTVVLIVLLTVLVTVPLGELLAVVVMLVVGDVVWVNVPLGVGDTLLVFDEVELAVVEILIVPLILLVRDGRADREPVKDANAERVGFELWVLVLEVVADGATFVRAQRP